MLRYVWNVVYSLLLVLAAPWLLWRAAQTGRYRAGWREKLLGLVPPRSQPGDAVWFHAVSVGEVNLLAPILRALRSRWPDTVPLITTTTTTGYALARQKYPQAQVAYAPLDFSWSVAAVLRRWRPRLVVLVELELWPNLIDAARRAQVPVAIVNGRLSERSFRGYRRLRPLVRRTLCQIDLIAVQDETYAQRFLALGARSDSVVVTGSIKYDGAQFDRQQPATQRLRALAGLDADDVVWLAGSTQAPEEAIVLSIFQRLAKRHPRLRLILVPRHAERFDEVATLLAEQHETWQRRSRLEADRHADQNDLRAAPRIVLVDTIGELGAWWGTADIAFVGGSLGSRGGQNMIEPAAYGAAVSFGPNTRNFRDIVAAFLEQRGAVVVEDAVALERFVERCLLDPAEARALGERARRWVMSQQGATERTLDRLSGWLSTESAHRPPESASRGAQSAPHFRASPAESPSVASRRSSGSPGGLGP